MKWGLVPSWSADPSISNHMINARAETITEKPSYRRLSESKRCLIPKVFRDQQRNAASQISREMSLIIRLDAFFHRRLALGDITLDNCVSFMT
jgi:putative SOS response-associated peptidase YedK